MDSLEFLVVRFHFGGKFFNDGKKMQYLGGTERVSFIDRNNISLPEVMGHLNDHFNPTDTVLLHWFIPGKDLRTGLRTLVDDKVCQEMCSCIIHLEAADIFVEVIVVEATKYLNWVTDNEDSNMVSKADKAVLQEEVSVQPSAPMEGDQSSQEDDKDYLAGDDESSEGDEEAMQIRADLKELKMKLEASCLMVVDEEGHEVNVENIELDGLLLGAGCAKE